jgi:hypothetical protein
MNSRRRISSMGYPAKGHNHRQRLAHGRPEVRLPPVGPAAGQDARPRKGSRSEARDARPVMLNCPGKITLGETS